MNAAAVTELVPMLGEPELDQLRHARKLLENPGLAAQLANAVGALSTTAAGAQAAMPTMAAAVLQLPQPVGSTVACSPVLGTKVTGLPGMITAEPRVPMRR